MKLSVVIPAYNEEKYIPSCLEALMSQEVPADEIIIVDNNSTDKTVEIASKYPVRIIVEKKQGMIPARNRGFDEAKFEIIARTDADSKPNTDWIKHIKHHFELDKNCDALSGSAFYDNLSEYINTSINYRYIKAMHFILGYYPLIGPNFALKKTLWNEVRDAVCTDEARVHEDIDLAIHIHKYGGEIHNIPHAVVYSSTRRLIQKPHSFFLEYPQRLITMLRDHNIEAAHVKMLKIPKIEVSNLIAKIQKKST